MAGSDSVFGLVFSVLWPHVSSQDKEEYAKELITKQQYSHRVIQVTIHYWAAKFKSFLNENTKNEEHYPILLAVLPKEPNRIVQIAKFRKEKDVELIASYLKMKDNNLFYGLRFCDYRSFLK